MPRSALEEGQITSFRERLCGAAERLFAERGYDGVTLRALASELGCSPMTPYRYFRDKAEIFTAVRTAAYARFATAQDAARASSSEPAEQLLALGRVYVRFGIENPDAYRLMFELAQPDPGGFPELRAAELRVWASLRDAIRTAIEAGLLGGDPETVAHVFWGGVHGIVSLHLAGKLALGRSLEEVVEPMLATLFLGSLPHGRTEA